MWRLSQCNLLKLLLITAFIHSTFSAPIKCGFERLEERVRKLRNLEDPVSRVASPNRETTWSPIRFYLVYYSSLTGADEDYIKNDVVSNAIAWFENSISVKRLTEKLKIPSYFEGSVEAPDYLFTEGVDADYILFVNLYSDSDDSVVGSASFMYQDDYTYQPTIGFFELNYVKSWDIMAYDDLLATTIHEITHALVFHPQLYRYYLDSSGELYTDDIIETKQRRGTDIVQIVTPKVVEKARAAFDCSSLDGVELEITGGEGTYGAHWEKRMMYTDYMVADSDVNDFIYSDISLALFEDSGWYKPSYRYSQDIEWGYKQGCDFLEKKCIIDNKPTNSAFCVDESKYKCDFSRLHRGVCNLVKYESDLPSEYAYFEDSTIGGSDQYLDYCPVVKQYKGGSCRGLEMDATDTDSDYGEQICENCRCVEGTYSKSSAHHHVGCHWIECEEDHTIVHIGDEEVICPENGGEVEVPNYEGVLYCPMWTQVCNPAPCMNACSGIGVCDRGVCKCPDGSMGGDCSGIEKDFSYRDPIDERDEEQQAINDTFDGLDPMDSASAAGLMSCLVLLIFW